MSTNPIDKNSTPKPTGSLEELFRHHLGEEAAVPTRPMLWDQIDNSLLIRQNEVYRKRLVATRWVAAASLFLATLAGTGWWSTHDSHLGDGSVATASRPAASGAGTSANNTAATGNTLHNNGASGTDGQMATPESGAASVASAPGANGAAAGSSNSRHGFAPNDMAANGSTRASAPANQTAAAAQRSTMAAASGYSATRQVGFGAVAAHKGLNNAAATTGYSAHYNSGAHPSAATRTHSSANSVSGATNAEAIAAYKSSAKRKTAIDKTQNLDADALTLPATSQEIAVAGVAATAGPTSAATGTVTSSLATGVAEGTSAVAALTSAAAVVAPEQVDLLAARAAALNMAAPNALPAGLAAVSVPEPEPTPATHRWHYGASYTAGVFNPNINFSRVGIEPEHDYNPALGPDSPALTEAAATQYRQHLRSGISQRIALLATRHLSGHWSLSTGAEFTRATAKSATTTSFVGEQLPDLGQSGTGPLHTTDFSYSLASIPVEVRYSNPVKRGWSLYGRLGGVVSAILGVRSEVEDNPEATRTYSILSAGTPYRRAVVNLRGAAGTQFRNDTGKWAFTLGPVAEIGLTSLNAHPVQSYLAQSHAYSFGLEAGVEFGR